MLKYNLNFSEGVFLECENVRCEGISQKPENGDLVVTNENLIWLTETGVFKKVVNQSNISLRDIKVVNDQVQIKSSAKLGESPTMIIFLNGKRLEFTFNWGLNAAKMLKDIENHISHILTGKEIAIEERIIPGTEAIAETIGGTIRTLKKSLKAKIPTAARCVSCGASISGLKGQVVKCPYCSTKNEL